MPDSPEPKRRQRDDPAVRRAQILDEAIRIIGERGYYGFAVQDLAQRCGLTTGGLLYHFNSKEVLLLAVLEEYERLMEASLRALLGDSSVEQLATRAVPLGEALQMFRAIIEHSAAHPHLMHLDTVLRAEALHRDHPGYDALSKREAMIIGMFALVVRAHCAEPERTARQIYALMSGLEYQWLRADCSFDLLAEWDCAIALILPEGDGA